MSSVRAKMQCVAKIEGTSGTLIRLVAIYADHHGVRAEENKAFTDATPSAEVCLTIAHGKAAADHFAEGSVHYVDFNNAVNGPQPDYQALYYEASQRLKSLMRAAQMVAMPIDSINS